MNHHVMMQILPQWGRSSGRKLQGAHGPWIVMAETAERDRQKAGVNHT